MDGTIKYCGSCGDEIYEDNCMSLECRIKRDGPIHLQELPCPSCAAKDARLALLEKVVKAAKWSIDHCPYCEGKGYVEVIATGSEHDPNCDGSCVNCPIPVPIRVQEQCEYCGDLRSALREVEE